MRRSDRGAGRFVIYLLFAIGCAGFGLTGCAVGVAGLVNAVTEAAHAVRGMPS